MTYINETRAQFIDDWLTGKITNEEMDRLARPPICVGKTLSWLQIYNVKG